MARLIAVSLLILSFVVSPAFAECCDSFSEAGIHHDTRDDSGKADLAIHHCGVCHVHYGDRTTPNSIHRSLNMAKETIQVEPEIQGSSIITGPLLEPPSHV